MKITKRQLMRIIKEEVNEWDSPSGAAQMSSPEQRDPGGGGPADAARLLGGILDDWMNEPEMNFGVGDQFRKRLEKVETMLKGLKEKITRLREDDGAWSPEEIAKVKEAGRWYFEENQEKLMQGGTPSALEDLEEVAYGDSDPADTGWTPDEAEAILDIVDGLLFQESGGRLGQKYNNSIMDLPS